MMTSHVSAGAYPLMNVYGAEGAYEEGTASESWQETEETKLAKNAFAKSKATKLVIKTKLLKKKAVKGSLKKSKVKTIQVKVGKKKDNKKFVKKYKKIFTKKNVGKKPKVK